MHPVKFPAQGTGAEALHAAFREMRETDNNPRGGGGLDGLAGMSEQRT
jgi:hypothetical protein